jgi:hypothetical protein
MEDSEARSTLAPPLAEPESGTSGVSAAEAGHRSVDVYSPGRVGWKARRTRQLDPSAIGAPVAQSVSATLKVGLSTEGGAQLKGPGPSLKKLIQPEVAVSPGLMTPRFSVAMLARRRGDRVAAVPRRSMVLAPAWPS